MTKVLVAEDDRVARDLLCEILRGEGFEVEAVDDGAGAVERAVAGRYDLVVSDVRMERSGGLDVLKAFTERAPLTPVILITAFGDVTGAMEAIQRGAYDYVSKPFNVEELKLTVARALERKRLVAEQKTVPSDARTNLQDIVGKTPVMLEVYKLVARVAASTATVLVSGESGTGKELVARAIHTHSPRATAAFVPVNCTALTESLLESELFRPRQGRVHGRHRDEARPVRDGPRRHAVPRRDRRHGAEDAGPALADVCRTARCAPWAAATPSASTCASCARRTRTSKRRSRPGGSARISTSASTSSRSACHRCANGARTVPMLVGHFLNKLALRERREPAAMSPEALKLLTGYAWPGNVRELENAIERAVAVAKGKRHPALGPAPRGGRRQRAGRGRRRRPHRRDRRAADARGARASLHPARAGRVRRQQEEGRREAGHRSSHAVSRARARRRADTRPRG